MSESRTRLSMEQRRLILRRRMLLHTCVGHPVAAWLSRFGARRLAEHIHYWTLPLRIRRRVTFDRVRFQHDPRLHSMDALWVPLASLAMAAGRAGLAARLWLCGPAAVATELGSCSYALPCECHCGCRRWAYGSREICFICSQRKHAQMTNAAARKDRERVERDDE